MTEIESNDRETKKFNIDPDFLRDLSEGCEIRVSGTKWHDGLWRVLEVLPTELVVERIESKMQ